MYLFYFSEKMLPSGGDCGFRGFGEGLVLVFGDEFVEYLD